MNPLDTELARLTITAYSDRKMTDLVGSIEATCNPETVDLGYQIEYKAEDYINQVEAVSEYQRAKPGDLKLELIFDAKLPDDTEPVQQQIEQHEQKGNQRVAKDPALRIHDSRPSGTKASA